MNWILIGQIVYLVLLLLVCLRIIYDTRSSTKTIAYLLLAIFLPIGGMIIYFTFGINYRKRKLYHKKLGDEEGFMKGFKKMVVNYSNETYKQRKDDIGKNKELVHLLMKDLVSPLTCHNKVKLFVNGEEKFPDVLEALRQAKHHIHIEYYIYEEKGIGREIADILMQKAREGVEVRFIYDDFGSRTIRKKLVKEFEAAGVKAAPFYKVMFIFLANRLNYRDHRKIIVIDGKTGYTGGINVSDRYINGGDPKKLYWRDTHLRIDGPGVYYLQYLFLNDWIFCTKEELDPHKYLSLEHSGTASGVLVQVASGGPDSPFSSILFSVLQAIYLAETEILITTPYYIPGESMQEALTIAALSGLTVKMLVPFDSDVPIVNSAAKFYYGDLLSAGVEIYQYKKGFLHAKTLVVDKKLTIVGTSNMDYRSFDLNFEVNAVVYDEKFSGQLRDVFFEDVNHAKMIDPVEWEKRPAYKLIKEKLARLLSPIL